MMTFKEYIRKTWASKKSFDDPREPYTWKSKSSGFTRNLKQLRTRERMAGIMIRDLGKEAQQLEKLGKTDKAIKKLKDGLAIAKSLADMKNKHLSGWDDEVKELQSKIDQLTQKSK